MAIALTAWMRTLGFVGAAVLLAAAAGLGPASAAAGAEATSVESDARSLAAAGVGAAGRLGVAAWRLDGAGPVVLVNADERFPMASTFKVAVAGAVLKRVDEGAVRLDEMISISLDQMVDSEVIQDRFIHPGVALSVYNLLELMLTESDNTATDAMVRLAGGPSAVTAWVRAQGVNDLTVDGGTDEIIRRYLGVSPTAGPFHEAVAAALAQHPELARRDSQPYPPFDDDLRDTASPRAMAQLLGRIFNGKALTPASTRVLTGIMGRCRTGAARLRGQMPTDSVVAHKTGTIGGSVNDVGVITLPRGAGEVVVAVFIKGSDAAVERREGAIAAIGRSVRDYYLFRYGEGR